MIPPDLPYKQFCAALRQEIRAFRASAFMPVLDEPNCLPEPVGIELYTDPDNVTLQAFKTVMLAADLGLQNSWTISQRHAQKVGAIRINDTLIGRLLTEMNLESYFRNVYGEDDKKIENAIYGAWSLASKEFVKQSQGHLYVACCGGRHDGVMRRKELETAAKNDRFTDINAASFDKFRQHKTPRARFRYACLTRLLLARREMHEDYSQENVIAYHTQLGFYRMGQFNWLRNAKKKSKSFYRGTAAAYIARMMAAVTKCAILNRQAVLSASAHDERSSFRPYSASSNIAFRNMCPVL